MAYYPPFGSAGGNGSNALWSPYGPAMPPSAFFAPMAFEPEEFFEAPQEPRHRRRSSESRIAPTRSKKEQFARHDSTDSGFSSASSATRKSSNTSTISQNSLQSDEELLSIIAEEDNDDSKGFKRNDKESDVVDENSRPVEEPTDELSQQIVEQLEFYFSDAHITKDKFLLKHVRRNKEGFVSLKLVSSFKRVKHVSRDWRQAALAVERVSKKLELNEERTKVRRLAPLPAFDETAPSRTVIAFNLPMARPTVEAVAEKFAAYGDIALVRILRPGNPVPEDLRPYVQRHPAVADGQCAVIEFERTAAALKAAMESNVKPLVLREKDKERRLSAINTNTTKKPGVEPRRRASDVGCHNVDADHEERLKKLWGVKRQQQPRGTQVGRPVEKGRESARRPEGQRRADQGVRAKHPGPDQADLNPEAHSFMTLMGYNPRYLAPAPLFYDPDAFYTMRPMPFQPRFFMPGAHMMRPMAMAPRPYPMPEFYPRQTTSTPRHRGGGFSSWCRDRMQRPRRSHAIPIVPPDPIPEETSKKEDEETDTDNAIEGKMVEIRLDDDDHDDDQGVDDVQGQQEAPEIVVDLAQEEDNENNEDDDGHEERGRFTASIMAQREDEDSGLRMR